MIQVTVGGGRAPQHALRQGAHAVPWRAGARVHTLQPAMFVFFSNRLGCVGSVLVSVALSALLYFVFMRGGCGGAPTGAQW